MLEVRESAPPPGGPDPGLATRGRDATEILMGVLGGIESYEACILEAEQDRDFEVADFLRELRRQDLARAREATRLLRRSIEAVYGDAEKEKAACSSYPLDLGFKIVTIGTRIRVTDATGRQVAYVRKKKFKLKEDVGVYTDEDQSHLLFRMKADKMWDFSARYAISGPDGHPIGAVGRQGVRSMWSSSYVLADASGREAGVIREENPWVKVLDSLMESVPFGDALGGLFFNPAYLADLHGRDVLRVKKQRSLLESSFRIEKLADFSEAEEELLLASIIMMVLLERDRG